MESRPNDYVVDDELTERVMMSLVVDVTQLHETVERVKVQVLTLARARGIVRDGK